MPGQISVSDIVSRLFYFYFLLIFVRIFLTWIPNIDWNAQPYSWLKSICDPYLNIFRGIIPPLGGMLDISPILAIILLQILQTVIVNILRGIGL